MNMYEMSSGDLSQVILLETVYNICFGSVCAFKHVNFQGVLLAFDAWCSMLIKVTCALFTFF